MKIEIQKIGYKLSIVADNISFRHRITVLKRWRFMLIQLISL